MRFHSHTRGSLNTLFFLLSFPSFIPFFYKGPVCVWALLIRLCILYILSHYTFCLLCWGTVVDIINDFRSIGFSVYHIINYIYMIDISKWYFIMTSRSNISICHLKMMAPHIPSGVWGCANGPCPPPSGEMGSKKGYTQLATKY